MIRYPHYLHWILSPILPILPTLQPRLSQHYDSNYLHIISI